MAELMKTKAGAKGKKSLGRGKLPVKRTINLATIGEQHIKIGVALPAIILIVLVVAVLSKFFVYDRMQAMSNAQHEANAAQAELDRVYARMDEYGELSEVYAHYTYSGMNAAELNRADRVEVVTMIEELIQPRAGTSAWTLTGNQVALTITGKSLEEINQLVMLIEDQKWVNYCTVANATASEETRNDSGSGVLWVERMNDMGTGTTVDVSESPKTVTSKITVYLKTPQEVSELESSQS